MLLGSHHLSSSQRPRPRPRPRPPVWPNRPGLGLLGATRPAPRRRARTVVSRRARESLVSAPLLRPLRGSEWARFSLGLVADEADESSGVCPAVRVRVRVSVCSCPAVRIIRTAELNPPDRATNAHAPHAPPPVPVPLRSARGMKGVPARGMSMPTRPPRRRCLPARKRPARPGQWPWSDASVTDASRASRASRRGAPGSETRGLARTWTCGRGHHPLNRVDVDITPFNL